jgi:hypothetical protein
MPLNEEQCEQLINRIGEDESTRLFRHMLLGNPEDALLAENEALQWLRDGNDNDNWVTDETDDNEDDEDEDTDTEIDDDDLLWIDANGQTEMPIVLNGELYVIWNDRDIHLNGRLVGHIDEDRRYMINGIIIGGRI